jgi:hypothetical protein
MKKNSINSCKLPQCYPASYDSRAYTKPRTTENFTATTSTPPPSPSPSPSILSEISFQETLTTLFPDKTYAFLGGVIVAIIVIMFFLLLGGGGGGGRGYRRNRRRSDDDYEYE